MSSNLESEDLEHVQLVRMEDVQPSREKAWLENVIVNDEIKREDLDLGTCIVDDLEFDNECVVDGGNDDDSNIGSMVSIHSEEVGEADESSSELIVPEIVVPKKEVEEINEKPKKNPSPESWPTLEILPGGVINHLEKCEDDLNPLTSIKNEPEEESGEMMYACAKCPQRFQYLCSLVKHVRWHALEQKRQKGANLLFTKVEPKIQKESYVPLNTACERTRAPPLRDYTRLRKPKTTSRVMTPIVLTKICKKKVVKILPKKPNS